MYKHVYVYITMYCVHLDVTSQENLWVRLIYYGMIKLGGENVYSLHL